MAATPRQARSADSARRMLEAGEELFLIGGSDALKLESIIERAGTSTGSFYARFGSLQGYLDALHDRALVRIEESLAPVLATAAEQTTLDDTLHVVVRGSLKVLRRDRASVYYFAVGGTQAPHTRERGAVFTRAFRDTLMHLAGRFIADPADPNAQRRLDMMCRMFIAMAFQQVMFDQEDISPLRLSDTRLAAEWAAALTASLGVHGPG